MLAAVTIFTDFYCNIYLFTSQFVIRNKTTNERNTEVSLQ